MTGCQAAFSILQMNHQRDKTEEQDMEIDKGSSDRINETSSSIIDNIYETRRTLRITRLVNEVASKVHFQDAQQQDENTKGYDDSDPEIYAGAIQWMSTVHTTEIVYGLCVGEQILLSIMQL